MNAPASATTTSRPFTLPTPLAALTGRLPAYPGSLLLVTAQQGFFAAFDEIDGSAHG